MFLCLLFGFVKVHNFLSIKEIFLDFQNPRIILAMVPKRAGTLDEASPKTSAHSGKDCVKPVRRVMLACFHGSHPEEETTLPVDSLV